MKKIVLLFIIAVICFFDSTYAQKQSVPPNTGSFYVSQTTSLGKEQINVNYVLQSAPFINSVKLLLNTPNVMMMSVKMYNDAGAQVMSWMPEQANSSYEHEFDISNLKAAKYRMDIYSADNKKLHSISFVKQSSAN